ncbi:putative Ig domain-containing protein [Spirosoma agri]|nr:putative Ig domain-containing protein [Spirosoma agri]
MTAALLCFCFSAMAQTTTKEAALAAKVTPDLYQVMQNRGQAAPALIEGFLLETNQVFVDNKIAIEAIANNEDGEELLNQLKALGLTDGVAYKRIVFGYLPIDKINELKNVQSLSFARSSYKPLTNTGSVTSQGDVSLRANTARSTYSVTGAGVKVGVLSDSYNNLGGAATGVSTNDLPAAGVQVLQDLTSGGSDEGRAMAEIVHDLAPGSAIAFNTAFTGQAGFAQGIINLAAAGCQIIVDDVFYYLEPFFQDGPIAQAITQVANNNSVTYFSLAGNHARSSYQAPYKSGGTYNGFPTHDFGNGTVDNKQRLTIPAGSILRLVLQWDNPFQSVSGGTGATTDLDYYILSTSGTVLAAGTTSQANGGDPVEYFGQLTNTNPVAASVDLVIVKRSGPDPGFIKWVNFGNGAPRPTVEYDTQSSTLVGHSNSAKAISVGAAPYFNTPAFNGAATATIEGFSSAGGTPVLFTTSGTRINGITGTVYQKPEITSVDGGDNTFFGSDIDGNGKPNFFGTSAAAPHAAAVGALMKQKVPGITAATILSTLKSTALDMDDPSTAGFDTGFDYGTGFGFIQADRALQAIAPVNTPPMVANAVPPQSATVGVAFTYNIPDNTFTDAETPNSLTLSVSGLPAGLSFTAPTTISGTPSTTAGSPFTVMVKATDPGNLSASTTFTFTVNPAASTPPSGSFAIVGVTTVSCTTISAGQRTLTFNPQYSGVNGQPISFSVANESLPTTAPGPYTLNLYTDNPVIILRATQTGTAGEASFNYNWLGACGGPTPPPSTDFTIVGVTTVSCTTISAGQRSVSFTPQYSGTTGQPISFSVVNELLPTTAPGPYTLNLYTDNPVIVLKAAQTGTATVASYTYNWFAACGSSTSAARIGVSAEGGLSVRVLGNPVPCEVAEIEIKGTTGVPVAISLLDAGGRVMHEHQITEAAAVERVNLPIRGRQGLLLLTVSTPTERKTIKLIKQ